MILVVKKIISLDDSIKFVGVFFIDQHLLDLKYIDDKLLLLVSFKRNKDEQKLLR
jgi:hypothetical protein